MPEPPITTCDNPEDEDATPLSITQTWPAERRDGPRYIWSVLAEPITLWAYEGHFRQIPSVGRVAPGVFGGSSRALSCYRGDGELPHRFNLEEMLNA